MDDKQITDFLLYETPLVQTDVIVLPGSGSVSGVVARAGAEIYKKGLSRKFILTGGVSTFQPHVYMGLALSGFKENCKIQDFFTLKREADYMADILVKSGVSHNDIVFKDTKATNTGENFDNIRDVLGLFGTAAIITPAHHQRRALATALKSFAGTTPPAMVTYGLYPFGVGRDNWPVSPLANYVRGEAHKVNPEKAGQKGNYVGRFCVALSDEDISRNLQAVVRHHTPKNSL